MTMSLSVARPIFTPPGGVSVGAPGRRILSIEVAMFDVPPDLFSIGRI